MATTPSTNETSKLTRKGTQRPLGSGSSSTWPASPAAVDAARSGAKLARQMSLRHVRPTETDREDRRRRRNRESARRARDRERSERDIMERAYDANEVRIKHLEIMVDELSSELRRRNTISSVRDSPAQGSGKAKEEAFEVPEDRPNWFGAAF